MKETTAAETRAYWPLGILGLGGLVTVAWIGSLAWMAWETIVWAVQ